MLEAKKIKVLYITGWGRSGSTILSNILGQIDGFFAVGELRDIWKRGLIENRLCGCGLPFQECKTWQWIIEDMYRYDNKIDPTECNHMTFRFTRTMRIFRFIAMGSKWNRDPELVDYLKTLESLYKAIAHITKCHVIVDSSKFPLYGAMLKLIHSLDVHIVHLVRDPRAVAYSWMQPKKLMDTDETEYMPFIGPAFSTIWWMGWNLIASYLGRLEKEKYYFVKYKDLVQQPYSVINDVLKMVDEPGRDLPFENENIVHIERVHTISGNPVRFNVGKVSIKLDARWRSEMSVYLKFLISLLSFPLLTHYRYPFFTSSKK